ncbi:uncharacterized protein HD556DRAFT_1448654 [Suillus plorans]|uniref:Uncharacterized protein n=1 Tax=Suillus plorans TaxID=116603 RepID=A0A9P7ADX9_9AGAM|nr:uncharacterized protein HD556DRAFT_1448654 [Suillus plorans]KAG1787467.1 hypothetical protein HD556DRAFT_1448654 [Suillus plorans]
MHQTLLGFYEGHQGPGQEKKQSGVPKETYYLQLAGSVFANDKDPEMRLLFQQNPKAFIKPVQMRFKVLKKKYNEVNATLKQPGAEMTFDDLHKNPETKTLLNSQLVKFLWWLELHNFESAALQHLNVSGSKDMQVSDGEENLLEDSEIMDMDNTDTHLDDIGPVPVAD